MREYFYTSTSASAAPLNGFWMFPKPSQWSDLMLNSYPIHQSSHSRTKFPSVLTQINYLCIPFCRFLNPNSCCNNLGCKKSHEHPHIVSENETTQNDHFNSGENDGKPWNFGVSQFLNQTMFFAIPQNFPEKSFVQTTITIQSTTPIRKSNHPHEKIHFSPNIRYYQGIPCLLIHSMNFDIPLA